MVALSVAALGAIGLALRPRPVAVDVGTVARGDLELSIAADGRTRVRSRFIVSAPLLGRVLRIDHRAGDKVSLGQPLAVVLPQPAPLLDATSVAEAEARAAGASAAVERAKAAVTGAKTALDLAKADRVRAEELGRAGATPRAEVERLLAAERLRSADLAAADFSFQVAQHEASMSRAVLRQSQPATAEKNVRSLVVSSPVQGTVLKTYRESEGAVTPGTPLLEVGDLGNMEIVVDLLTTDAVRVLPGQPATVNQWGGAPLSAHVRLVEPSATTKLSALGIEEQRVDVVLDLDSPRQQWESMGDGYRVEVRIEIERFPNAVLLPLGALYRNGETENVFAFDDAGFARSRRVEISARGERFAAVGSGLEAGERVILHPTNKITEGARVTPR